MNTSVTHELPPDPIAACLQDIAAVLDRVQIRPELAAELRSVADRINQNWWRSMDTSPKDGTEVLLLIPNQGGVQPGYHQVVGTFRTEDSEWLCAWAADAGDFMGLPAETYTPIAWKPLPQPEVKVA